nr:hypothetical protein [Tanacetum cinerariifolium]
MRHGFDLGYKTWIHHGEPALSLLPPVIDNTRQPQMSDITALLNDLSYIPPNNEHNEPTHGDIGETSNETNQATCNEFEELYFSPNEELYPKFFQNVFPISKGYKLPPSYYAIKKTFKTIGLGYESIHACERDCCLFRGKENKDLDFCAVCNTSRWKDSNTSRKKVSKKVLHYFSIISRLQRLYKSSYTAKEMIWHATGKYTEPGKMQHPVDGSAWKKFDTMYLDFKKEPRNVRLGLAADGFNPFENLSQAYRILPTRVKGKHPSYGGVKIKRNVHVELNWTKQSIFYELEYWSFLTLRHNLDIMHIEKNVLEAILNTLLMNDKSKDTAKERQNLKRLGIRSDLWLGQTKKEKCLKLEAAYSFTPKNKKKFCQFIKGVKLPDGFGSCFKHKVTDNDTNITGLESHDCHIMMQRLLLYGLQQYLPNKIAKPIIELCSLFKQICSATLMEDDILKAQIKVVDNLCDLELIYPSALFDIMIHLVIHLPLKALEGRPIRPRWMFPFERYMKKLKGYVQNKAKPKGSIMEGYVAEEALTFSSHYFWDVTTKFNRPDRNVDPPPPTYNDKDPEVSTTNELFALAYGPTWTSISVNFCVVDSVRYVMHNCDERCTTQNSGICSSALTEKCIMAKTRWKVVEHVNHKKLSNGSVIVVEDDPDIIHFDNSSDLLLSTSLNDLDNTTLYIDGQSMKVDAPPYIIDFPDEDDDIIDDEDALPHDLTDSDNEDLINVDDDGVDKMSVDVARSHDGDGGGKDRPPALHVPTGCGGCFANRRMLHTRDKTRNLSLKEITDKKAPSRSDLRGVPLYYPSWLKVLKKRKATLIIDIGTQFDLRPHMESPDWTEIDAGIHQHLQKAYNTNKAAFKAEHWVIDPETETYNVEKIRRARPAGITAEEWDKYIQFWNDPRNITRAAQNRQNQAKSTVISR